MIKYVKADKSNVLASTRKVEASDDDTGIYYCDDIHPANFDMIAKYIMRSE